MKKEALASQSQEAALPTIQSTVDKHSSKDVPKSTRAKEQFTKNIASNKAGQLVPADRSTSKYSPGINGNGLSSMACCTEPPPHPPPPSLLNIESSNSNVMSLTSIGENSTMTQIVPPPLTSSASATNATLSNTSIADGATAASGDTTSIAPSQASHTNAGRKRSRSSSPQSTRTILPYEKFSSIGSSQIQQQQKQHPVEAKKQKGCNNSNAHDAPSYVCNNDMNICEEELRLNHRTRPSPNDISFQEQSEQTFDQRDHRQQQHNQLSTEQINTLIDNINLPTQIQKQIPQGFTSTKNSAFTHHNATKETIGQAGLDTEEPERADSETEQNNHWVGVTPRIEGTIQTNAYINSNSNADKIAHPYAVTNPYIQTSQNHNIQSEPKGRQSKTEKVTLDTFPSTSLSKAPILSSSKPLSTAETQLQQLQSSKSASTAGRWSRSEHEAFLEGLKIHGREWKKVAQRIPTRTSAQIRSHAQKYFAKLARDEEQQANIWLTIDNIDNSNLDPALSQAGGHGDSMVSTAGGNKVGIMEGDRLLKPSVIERAKKILKDPRGAQLEVEATLARLRNRYNELQQKLQDRQNAKNAAVAAASNTNSSERGLLMRSQKKELPNMPSDERQIIYHSDRHMPSCESPHNRRYNEMSKMTLAPEQNNDNIVVESSRVPKTHRLRKDDLASKELIALHVLGGELYRSGSKDNLKEKDFDPSNCDGRNAASSEPQASASEDQPDSGNKNNVDAADDAI